LLLAVQNRKRGLVNSRWPSSASIRARRLLFLKFISQWRE